VYLIKIVKEIKQSKVFKFKDFFNIFIKIYQLLSNYFIEKTTIILALYLYVFSFES